MAAIIKLSENAWVNFFLWKWLNPRWQNLRWLPSSSWVRMNVFESDWIRLIQSFVQQGWIQDGRIQDGCHHLVSQIELVWVRVRVEGECFWVKLREDNKVFESKMAVSESNMAEFKMAAIIKLSQNEQVNFIVQNGWIQDSRIQDGCYHQVESEWMSEVFFLCKMAESKMAEFKMTTIIKLSENAWVKFFLWKWLNPRWQISRWVPSSSWVKMNEFESDWTSLSQSFVQNGWIQDGRIQDGYHH